MEGSNLDETIAFEEFDDTQLDDSISAVEFSADGNLLATGDRSGRITVMRIQDLPQSSRSSRAATAARNANHGNSIQRSSPCAATSTWSPFFQFVSHDPEFDYLKSVEIEARISQIKFTTPCHNNNFILSTNDRTIKLWRIGQSIRHIPRAVDSLYDASLKTSTGDIATLLMPQVDDTATPVELLQARIKRTYANAHAYHINSLAVCADQESFFSGDDLRINWWRLDNSDVTYTLVDIKPDHMKELTEVVTAVQCHPFHAPTIAYSSSKGSIKLCDTRSSALCSNHSKIFIEPPSQVVSRSFANQMDILNSISDFSFSGDGRYIISRDYLTLKIWDVNMESRPLRTVALHDHLRPILYNLYSNDCVFDKFEVAVSPDGQSMVTGSYSNQLKVFHQDNRGLSTVTIPSDLPVLSPIIPTQLTSDICVPVGTTNLGARTQSNNNTPRRTPGSRQVPLPVIPPTEEVRVDERILNVAWHPTQNVFASCTRSRVSLYAIPK